MDHSFPLKKFHDQFKIFNKKVMQQLSERRIHALMRRMEPTDRVTNKLGWACSPAKP